MESTRNESITEYKKLLYEAPELIVIEYKNEKGFALSSIGTIDAEGFDKGGFL